MLNNIRRAAPSIGKIVGKGKYASVLWVLNPDRDTYYQIREAKTKAYAARRAKAGAYSQSNGEKLDAPPVGWVSCLAHAKDFRCGSRRNRDGRGRP